MAFISMLFQLLSRFHFDLSPALSRADDDTLLKRDVVSRCGDHCAE